MAGYTLIDSVADIISDVIGIDSLPIVPGKYLIFDTGELVEFDDASVMEIE